MLASHREPSIKGSIHRLRHENPTNSDEYPGFHLDGCGTSNALSANRGDHRVKWKLQ